MKLLHIVANEPFTESVVAFTGHLADLLKAPITLLYAANSQAEMNKGYIVLEKARHVLDSCAQQITVRLVTGDKIETIVEEMGKEEYDLAIFELRRRRKVLPSKHRMFSQKILKHAPIPVMLVRRVNFKLEKVLVCTGGQSVSDKVVQLSAHLTEVAGLHATILHVSPSLPSMYTGMGEMDGTLDQVLKSETPLAQHLKESAETFAEQKIDARVEIRHGAVAEEILTEAEEGAYDLIVLGATGQQAIDTIFLSDVTQQVINRSSSAVLVVK